MVLRERSLKSGWNWNMDQQHDRPQRRFRTSFKGHTVRGTVRAAAPIKRRILSNIRTHD